MSRVLNSDRVGKFHRPAGSEFQTDEAMELKCNVIIIIIIIIIIMYIYHVLINALSARMIHINPNMIFYTHVEHSPTKTVYIKY